MKSFFCCLGLLFTAIGASAQTPLPTPSSKPEPAKAAPPAEVEIPFPADLPIPPAPALTPDDELKTFKLAPGFRAELVAADPMIGEPVAMTFDNRGRIWVVEMRGYMPNIDGKGEDEPNGRIVILEDTDGDGRMDKETVFLDKLVMPRAILLRKGGAIVAEPPALYWCPDADGDDRADEKIVVHPTYTTGGNPEHMPNGLLSALDNWIYNAKSNERYRFTQSGAFLKEKTAYRGQWGIAQDDVGRLYFNYNSDQLRADLLPAHYLGRNPNFRAVEGLNVQIAQNQKVYPARVTPGVNRGYQPGLLHEGKLVNFTAASAPVVYRGDLFPEEFRGNSFVPEPSANLIKRNIHQEKDGTISATQAYEGSEFMTSTDERFRPVSLTNGPDGALYVVDMYRGVIQHITYVTPWLRKQYIERGLDQPLHQGRIWRIVPEGAKTAGYSKPTDMVAELGHANGWRRDAAQRQIVDSGDTSLVPELQKLSKTGTEPLGRLHALWTLEGLEKLDAATALAALADTDARVRAHAIRLVEPFARKEPGVAQTLLGMVYDRSTEVRLQLLLTLGELTGERATAALAKVLAKDAENPLARTAALSGLKGRELEFLESLIASPNWATESPGTREIIAQLARCVLEERNPQRVTAMLAMAATDRPDAPWQQSAMLDGLAGTIPPAVVPLVGKPSTPTGHRKGFKPVALTLEPAPLAALSTASDPTVRDRAAKIRAILTWSGKPDTQPVDKAPPLTEAQLDLVAQGKQLYAGLCGACHQPGGQGQEGLAPPLVNSEWVLGSTQRLVRIILHGVGGPIEVAGKGYNLDMPGLGAALSDEQIAQIISYIRNDWGHSASAIEPATIAAIRNGTKDRGASWSAAELETIH